MSKRKKINNEKFCPETFKKPIEKILYVTATCDMGIIPLNKDTDLVKTALVEMTEQEQRITKRKFRKAWRKAYKAKFRSEGPGKAVKFGGWCDALHLNYGSKPNRSAIYFRKRLVREHIWEKNILPVIEKLKQDDIPV